jgi:hypothetical protein
MKARQLSLLLPSFFSLRLPGLLALVCLVTLFSPAIASAQSVILTGTPPNFGSVNVCATGQATPAPCSQALTLNYSVTTGGTLGTPRVLTQGSPGLDFTLTSGSTCTGAVTTGSHCSVNVSFAPRYPGLVGGLVQVVDGSGNVLAATVLRGTGVGPEISFSPAAQIVLPGTSFAAWGLAVDGAGDLFVGEVSQDLVVKYPAGGGAPVTIGSGINSRAIAVDLAGNVYVADVASEAVIKIPADGSAPSSLAGGLGGADRGSGRLVRKCLCDYQRQ